MFKPPLTPEQWAQARRLREEGASFADIAEQVGSNRHTISRRALVEGWPIPPGSRAGAARAAAARPREGDTTQMRRGVMRRFYRVMDLKLELMELRMKKQVKHARRRGGDVPSTDEEKDMRPMTAAMKTLEQAKELDPDLDRAAGGGPTSSVADAAASEEEAFRREIAERLEKLIPPS